MRYKMMVVSMLWFTTALGNDVLPPGLPFPSVDDEGVPAVQPQDVPGGTLDDSRNQPIGQALAGGQQPVTNGLQSQHGEQQPDAAYEQAAQEQGYEKPARKIRQNRRPRLLDTSPRNRKEFGRYHELDGDLQSGLVIKPKSGKTENIVIARGKLNRIVTPYTDPKVLTSDAVDTKVDGSSVYIFTDSGSPVSLFITDAETSAATSLVLTPQSMVAPVEMRIDPEPGRPVDAASADSQNGTKLFKQDSPYISGVKAVMQALGKQLIPQGFTLENGDPDGDISMASICHGQDITFLPGQVLVGDQSRIVVFIAQNNGVSPVMFEEAFCASDNTVAVAAWPNIRLAPGERTEVYILMRTPDRKDGEESRPALL
jgi:TraK protein